MWNVFPKLEKEDWNEIYNLSETSGAAAAKELVPYVKTALAAPNYTYCDFFVDFAKGLLACKKEDLKSTDMGWVCTSYIEPMARVNPDQNPSLSRVCN